MSEQPASSFRLDALEVRGFRALQRLRLPEDGLGWDAKIPDLVVVGGANGTGKTAFLDLLVHTISGDGSRLKSATSLAVRFSAILPHKSFAHCVLRGNARPDLVSTAPLPTSMTCVANSGALSFAGAQGDWMSLYSNWEPGQPRVVYFPSQRRGIDEFQGRKAVVRTGVVDSFLHVWQRPESWEVSLEARLNAARLEDLNAREEGEAVNRVQPYADAFARLFPGKQLVWKGGDLAVAVGNAHHPLHLLSSGEQRVLIIMGEIIAHWTPGSMVLIDEPELHLHPQLTLRFFYQLQAWICLRGGQLILATQSNELFRQTPSGTKIILGTR